MSKSLSRKTVIIVLALFLTLSVGYAIFSETITIEGTATAQGNFDIESTCEMGMANALKIAFGFSGDEFGDEGGFKNDICTVVDDKVSFSAELEYPGAQRYVTIKLTNTGTIDAIIDTERYNSLPVYSGTGTIKVYDSQTNQLYEEITDSFNSENDYWSSKLNDYYNIYPQIIFEGIFFSDSDGSFLTKIEDDELYEKEFIVRDSNNSHYLRLKPNQSAYILGYAKWDEDSEINGYYAEAKSTFNFEFTQMSSDMEVITDPNEDNICFYGC